MKRLFTQTPKTFYSGDRIRKLLTIFVVLLSAFTMKAQMVTIASSPGTSPNTPMGLSNYHASESIYLQSEINVAMTMNRINLSCATLSTGSNTYNINVYLKTTTASTFVAGAYSLTGYTLVYSGPITFSAINTYTGVSFTTPFPYANTPGQNLQVLIIRTDGAVHAGNVFNCTIGNPVLGTTANTSRRYNGTTAPVAGTTSLGVTPFRPAIQIGQIYNTDAAVSNIYTLGKLPIQYGTPTVISANITNAGLTTLTNLNVGLAVTGTNSFTDNQVITSLAPGASTVVSFATYTPANLSTGDLINVAVVVPGDLNPTNDNLNWSQDVTQNVYSYKNPAQPNAGGVGFNGATGDFVAKFNSHAGTTYPYTLPPKINEIKVDLTTSGQPYQIGIWDATGAGGTPGANLWTSASLTSSVGTSFISVPDVPVSGDYFVGVRQTGTVNIGFAYQSENPIRSGKFYYTSPTGGTTWTDFSPGAPFRFSIEVQVHIPTPPNCAINFLPANGGAITCNNPVLSWGNGGGGPTGYDVYFSSNSSLVSSLSPTALVSTNQPGTTYNPGTLTSGTTYYWNVIPKNSDGSAVGCTMQSFTTGSLPLCYCIPTYTGTICAGSISQISFNTLNNLTTCAPPAHTIYAPTGTQTTSVQQGGTYALTVTTTDADIVSVWIDYDQNGVFDASEWTQVSLATVANTPSTINVTIPGTATLGNTMMRVRSRFTTNPNTATDACTSFGSGSSQDYVITIIPVQPCSGIPAPGNTIASASTVCPGTTVNFSLQNPTNGTGVSYQWFNNSGIIVGATSNTYSQLINTADDIYCDVACGGNITSSSLSSIALSPAYNCICASAAAFTADEEIFNVTVGGNSTNSLYSLTNACTTVAPGVGSLLNQYSNFRSLGALVNVTQGNVVPFTIEENECDGATFYSFGSAIWIDFNQNGVFTDPGEQVFVENATAVGPRNVTGSFTIPVSALTGLTAMRITVAENLSGASLTPCLSYNYGETEDYLINIDPTTACTGTPTLGNTIASATNICPGSTVNLTLQNANSLGSGVTFQWYDNTGAITGATSVSYVAAPTTANSYYCIAVCPTSGLSSTSTSVGITINNFLSCYCNSNLHSSNSPCIDQIVFNSLSNNTAASGCALPAYTSFPASTATTTVYQGVTYNLTRTASGTGAWTGVWIDYNHSGVFEASEYINLSTVATGATNNIVAITIPATSLIGQTGMRIRQRVVDMTAADACTPNFGSGETEDYIIDIQPSLPCSGTPAPGNTIASATAVCNGATVNFSLQNTTLGTGVSYQWYNSAGLISGATTATYSAVISSASSYHCDVTCSSSTGSSTPVSITLNSPATCYCAAGASTIGCTTGDEYVGNVTFNTINNTSTCPTSGQYSDFTSQSTHVTQGSAYTASVLIPNWFSGDQAAVWIDYNQDGVLDDVTERTLLTTGGTSPTDPFTGNITIPTTSLSGATRMRVRGNYTGAMSSCGIATYGEVEDYTVIIDPLITNSIVNLNLFIQGYYDASTGLMNEVLSLQGEPTTVGACDSIDVELHDAVTPFGTAQSVRTVLQSNGSAVCTFPAMSGSYYIVVKHRNAIQTWSANPVTIGATPVSYNFTTAATQAYGDNQIDVEPGVWALYSGDIIQDENMDLLDIGAVESDISNFLYGYLSTDINGDGNVDLLDSTPVEDNINNFVFSNHP